MSGEFTLDSAGLSPLADIHSQVADGLSQLAGAGAPQAADVSRSFGNIAFAVNNALDGVTQSRASAFQTTKGASETIKELLGRADQMYAQGDQEGAAKLRAAAEALDGSGGTGGAGSAGGAAGGTGAGGAGAGSGASGGGAEMAGQMASQVGQQVGQVAQGMAQAVQGLAQGLTQLPQQIVQGIQGIAGSATKESDAAAKDDEAKADDPEERKREEAAAAEKRDQQSPTQTESARQGPAADGGRAPVPPPTAERPQPAQTRPQ
jgi:uncharacterized phage infection (PIP) family protein YhgE